MSGYFNWDITPLLLKGAAKVGELIVGGVIDSATKPKIDDTNHDEPIPPVAEKLKSNNTSGFILGDNVAKDETEDGHIMVVGGVGSGKSSCIAIPTLHSWGERVFAIDIKGELYEKTKYNGFRNIRLFNPLDPNALGYDPFYLLKRTTDHVQEAQAIAHALIPLPPNITEPFWIQSA